MNTFDLSSAFRTAATQEFADVPDEEEVEWVFSPQFLKKINRLSTASRYRYWRLINTTAKRVACIIAILATLTSIAMGIKPVRQPVFKFFIELYEQFCVITFGESFTGEALPLEPSMQRYALSILPEGFSENTFQNLTLFYRTIYSNSNGDLIILEQGNGQEEITLDQELADTVVLKSKQGISAICYTLENSTTLIWTQDTYSFNMTYFGKITIEQALELIDTLILKK